MYSYSVVYNEARHSCRVIQSAYYLVPSWHWGRGFEFCSGRGYYLHLRVCCDSMCRRSTRGFLRCRGLPPTPVWYL